MTSLTLPVPVSAVNPIPVAFGKGQLPRLFLELGYTSGAEIGVWRGIFTKALCDANPKLLMYAIDPWTSYPEWTDSKNDPAKVDVEAHLEAARVEAAERLAHSRCEIRREFSRDAVTRFRDRSLDFVYIDANHSFQTVTDDLTRWAPKVRVGGMVCGRGYRLTPEKPWIQVKAAADAYTAAHEIAPWWITAPDRYPTFFWKVR